MAGIGGTGEEQWAGHGSYYLMCEKSQFKPHIVQPEDSGRSLTHEFKQENVQFKQLTNLFRTKEKIDIHPDPRSGPSVLRIRRCQLLRVPLLVWTFKLAT